MTSNYSHCWWKRAGKRSLIPLWILNGAYNHYGRVNTRTQMVSSAQLAQFHFLGIKRRRRRRGRGCVHFDMTLFRGAPKLMHVLERRRRELSPAFNSALASYLLARSGPAWTAAELFSHGGDRWTAVSWIGANDEVLNGHCDRKPLS